MLPLVNVRGTPISVAAVALAAVAVATAAVATGLVPSSVEANAQPAARAPGDASAFMADVVRLVAANRYGPAWEHLDPRQQRMVPRSRYVACEQLTAIPGHVESLAVLDRRTTTLVVPGTATGAPAEAVTIRLTIAGDRHGERAVVRHTFHAVWVDEAWRWFLPEQRLRTYLSGGCSGAPRPPRGPTA
jgi:hypothetical protein